MNRTPALALGMMLCGFACTPAGDAPLGVRSLREQRGRKTITLSAWTRDVAEEIAAEPQAYTGKTLVVQKAYLNPKADVVIGKNTVRYPLRGGGTAVVALASVPEWLRQWTSAPLALTGMLHPVRSTPTPSGAELMLRAQSVALAHPLELTAVRIDPQADATWLVAHLENFGGHPASATLELRFGSLSQQRSVEGLPPNESAQVRLRLFGPQQPPWDDLGPEKRRLSVRFSDRSALALDLAKWLEEPADTLLDWGYSFSAPGNATLALSQTDAELERYAALELRSQLAQFTDANIEPREPDAAEPLPQRPLLVVGTPAHNALAAELVRTAGLADRLRAVGPEGYVLKTLQHGGRPTILVAAPAPRGVVYGVYALLEHYGVRFTFTGARPPGRRPFRVLDADEASAPLFAHRRLVAMGHDATATARWTQWEWLAMIDRAAESRFAEIVVPLNGLDTTFGYAPGSSQTAAFPFDVGPYTCVAEAYVDHVRTLAMLADHARRRGIQLTFAAWAPDGTLLRTAPPPCLQGYPTSGKVGEAIDVLDDPGDFLGLLRVEEAAGRVAQLLKDKASTLSVPYRRGASARASFLAHRAWDATFDVRTYYASLAASLSEGETAVRLAEAVLQFDRLDADVLAAAPHPFGLGPAPVLPVEPAHLACDWAQLRTQATGSAAADQMARLKNQSRKLRDLQAKLDPLHKALLEALGGDAAAEDDPLFSSAPAVRRRERISEAVYRFRALLGALASIQEAAMAYNAGLAEPADALPNLRVAAGKLRKARRILLWVLRRAQGSDTEAPLTELAERLDEQAKLLAEWLGPAAEAEPTVRLNVGGSSAVVHLFRTSSSDVYAAYTLKGQETVHLRLSAPEARLFRRGQPPKLIEAEGGLFLVALDRVPIYLVARRTAWPGQIGP